MMDTWQGMRVRDAIGNLPPRTLRLCGEMPFCYGCILTRKQIQGKSLCCLTQGARCAILTPCTVCREDCMDYQQALDYLYSFIALSLIHI